MAGGVKAAIVARARELGFDAIGVTAAELPAERRAELGAFLADGAHGDMDWLERRSDERGDPRRLWPAARSVVALAMNYGPDHDPLDDLARQDRGVVSVYARGRDYHDVVKSRLKALGRWIVDSHGGEVKVFVDTAPVMEKPLAERAGIGWQGKHTNLVSRRHGSWLFLGEIFTTLELEPDPPESDHCGSCRACQDICPTAAFPAPWRLDARRCISYLTIEHKGHIAREFRAAMGNRIYGCDDCLAVCPWNKYARRAAEVAFQPRPELTAPRLADLADLDDPGFREVFRGSPIKRTGRDRFVRNVVIALGNSWGPAALAAVHRRLDDGSPLVRAMAVWAFGRLAEPEAFAAARAARYEAEDDAAVRTEWDAPDHGETG
jgi:epoxyqueuosine reductase